MLITILALAMILGGIAATVALIAGWSLLGALAIYSGSGLLSVLMVLLYIAAISVLQNRKTDLVPTDAFAGN
jgi:protein-S-isoprenylcysteine O-methyltransferase Ste14